MKKELNKAKQAVERAAERAAERYSMGSTIYIACAKYATLCARTSSPIDAVHSAGCIKKAGYDNAQNIHDNEYVTRITHYSNQLAEKLK